MSLGRDLHRLRDGDISFAAFSRSTRQDWARLARYLLKRWDAGPAVGPEDVEQELQLAAWVAVGSWDPDRGIPIQRYVVFQACCKAKRWIHRQRGASSDHGLSRYPIGVEKLPPPREDDRDPFAFPAVAEAISRASYDEAELLGAVLLLGDCRGAADALFSVASVRARHGWSQPRQARTAVRRAVREVLTYLN